MKDRLLKTAVGTYRAVEWSGTNASGFLPIGDMVLVLPDEAAVSTGGGIVLPEEIAERHAMAAESGVIVAVADGAFVFTADRMRPWTGYKPQTGDRVRMDRYAGQLQMGTDGKQYRLMTDKCIGGVESIGSLTDLSMANWREVNPAPTIEELGQILAKHGNESVRIRPDGIVEVLLDVAA